MIHTLKAYIHYLIASKNQYGVHSPFLFDYVSKGLIQANDPDLENARSMRKELLSNDKEIQVTDFGAGSRVLSNTKRSISDIAAKAGISNKRGRLLAKTVAYFEPATILEIGTSLGISTAYLSSGAPQSKVITLEGCPEVASVAKNNFKQFGFNHIQLVLGQFENTLDRVLKGHTFDLIFFDGNHRKEPTISYFENCLNSSHENSVFIFDDIHWTPSMEAAWEYIKNHERVTLSVDTYKWGIVFFQQGRVKQHFTLRI